MNTRVARRDRGFTLIELMIVIAILGVMILNIPLSLPIATRFHRDTTARLDALEAQLGLADRIAADLELVKTPTGHIPRDRVDITLRRRSFAQVDRLEILLVDGSRIAYRTADDPRGPGIDRVLSDPSGTPVTGERLVGPSISYLPGTAEHRPATLLVGSGTHPRILSLPLTSTP